MIKGTKIHYVWGMLAHSQQQHCVISFDGNIAEHTIYFSLLSFTVCVVENTHISFMFFSQTYARLLLSWWENFPEGVSANPNAFRWGLDGAFYWICVCVLFSFNFHSYFLLCSRVCLVHKKSCTDMIFLF